MLYHYEVLLKGLAGWFLIHRLPIVADAFQSTSLVQAVATKGSDMVGSALFLVEIAHIRLALTGVGTIHSIFSQHRNASVGSAGSPKERAAGVAHSRETVRIIGTSFAETELLLVAYIFMAEVTLALTRKITGYANSFFPRLADVAKTTADVGFAFLISSTSPTASQWINTIICRFVAVENNRKLLVLWFLL